MLITPTNLALFFTALDTRFSQAFELTPTWNEQIVTTYPTATEQWVQGWLGALDKLRVWRGARVVHTPAPQTYGASVVPFELTQAIDKFKLEDDTHGIYGPMISHMGAESAKWPDYAVRDLIEATGDWAGTVAQTGVDGVSHWSASHPIDFWDAAKGTYTNDYGASGSSINSTTVGGAFATNTWASVYQDHASRKNESGEKIGVLPDLTMVPTYLGFAAKTVLQSQMFAPPVMQQLGTAAAGQPNAPFVGAMNNPLQGATDLMINVDLTSQVAWYQLTTKKIIKPFGWVLRSAPMIVQRTNPQDPAVFDSHTFIYGVEARAVPVWGLPWMSSRSGV